MAFDKEDARWLNYDGSLEMPQKEMTEEEKYAKEREAEEHLASLLQWNADAEFVSFGRIIF